MARKVIWTRPAWRDLEETANFISEDSPYYAAAFVSDVREAARSLKILSSRGRSVPEFGDSNFRELIVGNYRMIYRVYKQEVHVLALIHGARDLQRVWKKKKRE